MNRTDQNRALYSGWSNRCIEK